ncbi:PadR family transcriptional regulator [Paenibacillus albiflavus]|uniref:PadR family transcriptional regulator n=1 Tax=Paenibacillus albiflavus TaxID=2545760 RepID=A0A4R4DZI2_9BACL|nr:helix-turn-helix transcriptional regulator [Paenibacillus albiflavus]TCZ69944.1 PadR family transcriptional regulator [Paenibacillus albiflavus]
MSVQIYILSKLMENNSYPYKLKKQLSEPIPLDELSGLTESKLYYHFETLAKKGLIEAIEIIKEEHRPDKQVFAITDKGREELPKLIYKLFEKADDITEMLIALANIKYVDRNKVAEILEKKLNTITNRWNTVSRFEGQIKIDENNEKLVKFMVGYFSTKIEHKIYWLEELIKRIKQEEI